MNPTAPKIAVLTTGDELLSGELADTNTRRIALALDQAGLRLRESLTVGDNEEGIAAALAGLSARFDVVIVTGGLGATDDDRTARAAARAFKRPLTLNDEALRQIRAYFARNSRPWHPRNEKQALLPQRALVIPNPSGSAPGFSLNQDGKELIFLPGVPLELEIMLRESVLPSLRERFAPTEFGERIYTLLGVAEPRAEELIVAAGLPAGIEVGFGVERPLVYLKLRASGAGAERVLDRAEPAVLRAVGDYLTARGKESLAQTVAQLLTEHRQTLALAESCTGGLISTQLTAIPGSSVFLERSAVTYANAAKVSWLKIPSQLLEKEGAVSETTARLMARGIRRAAHTDFGLAVTGIAGPGGGSKEKPVGLVYVGLATAAGETVERHCFSGDRDAIRQQSAAYALDLLRRHFFAPLTAEESHG